jgi:HK97 family phage portal protein
LSRRKKTRQPVEKMDVSAGPSLVSRPISWLSSENTASGVKVSESTALGITTVMACIRLISTTCSSFPLNLFVEDDKDNIKRVRRHPLVKLLEKPNQFQTGYEWRQFVFSSLAFRGNSFNYVYRENGYAKAILPIHPDQCQVFVSGTSSDRELYYRVTFPESGEYLDLSADECLHFRSFGQSPYIGSDPLSLCREALGLSTAMERHGARVFGNGISASGVLETPGKLKPEQKNEIRNDWQRMQSGENAHKLAILEGGWKYTPIGISNENAQFLESRKFQADMICQAFGVPNHLVGGQSNVGVTSIETLNRGFHSYCLMPYLKNFEQRIDQTLLTSEERDKGMYSAHDSHAFTAADTDKRFASYASAIQNGWMSRNEVRAREDMSPYEGGDVYLTPLNMTPVGTNPDDTQGAN